MCIDAHIPSCSRQTLVLTISNVLVCLWVNVFLGQTKVNYVDNAMSVVRVSTDQEILWLHISKD